MCQIAAALSEQEIEALGEYYLDKQFVRASQDFDAAKAAEGKEIHDRECEKCHEDGGAVAEDDAGILAGQWTPYLRQVFEHYDSGERDMPKKMEPKYEKLDAAEKEALLHYYASLQ
jgi:sulfide dehydrogenase cytochrome subunit